MSDKLRGHPIRIDPETGKFHYADTGEPTVGNRRPCGYCGRSDTPEGHDGCLGELPGVVNACCGHGDTPTAYVRFEDGTELRGGKAVGYFMLMRRRTEHE